MREIIGLLLLIQIFFPLKSYGETKRNAEAIEIFEGDPGRPYSVVSPVSSDKKRIESAVTALKKSALAMGADAIIKLECQAGHSEKVGHELFGLVPIKQSINSVCLGMAVRWSNGGNSAQSSYTEPNMKNPALKATIEHTLVLLQKDGFINEKEELSDEEKVKKIVSIQMAILKSKIDTESVPTKKEIETAYQTAKERILHNQSS